jgi:hypothetical protein
VKAFYEHHVFSAEKVCLAEFGDTKPHAPRRLCLNGDTRWVTNFRMFLYLLENQQALLTFIATSGKKRVDMDVKVLCCAIVVLLCQSFFVLRNSNVRVFTFSVQNMLSNDLFWDRVRRTALLLFPVFKFLQLVQSSAFPTSDVALLIVNMVKEIRRLLAVPDRGSIPPPMPPNGRVMAGVGVGRDDQDATTAAISTALGARVALMVNPRTVRARRSVCCKLLLIFYCSGDVAGCHTWVPHRVRHPSPSVRQRAHRLANLRVERVPLRGSEGILAGVSASTNSTAATWGVQFKVHVLVLCSYFNEAVEGEAAARASWFDTLKRWLEQTRVEREAYVESLGWTGTGRDTARSFWSQHVRSIDVHFGGMFRTVAVALLTAVCGNGAIERMFKGLKSVHTLQRNGLTPAKVQVLTRAYVIGQEAETTQLMQRRQLRAATAISEAAV